MTDFATQRNARLAAKAARFRAPTVAIVPEPVPVAPAPPAPPTPAQVAQASARITALQEELRAFKAPTAPAPFPGEHEHVHVESYPPSPSRAAHEAAIGLIRRDPTLSYREAVTRATRRRA